MNETMQACDEVLLAIHEISLIWAQDRTRWRYSYSDPSRTAIGLWYNPENNEALFSREIRLIFLYGLVFGLPDPFY